MKKKYELDKRVAAEYLGKNDQLSKVAQDGLQRISEGKPIGPAMEHFLKILGILNLK